MCRAAGRAADAGGRNSFSGQTGRKACRRGCRGAVHGSPLHAAKADTPDRHHGFAQRRSGQGRLLPRSLRPRHPSPWLRIPPGPRPRKRQHQQTHPTGQDISGRDGRQHPQSLATVLLTTIARWPVVLPGATFNPPQVTVMPDPAGSRSLRTGNEMVSSPLVGTNVDEPTSNYNHLFLASKANARISPRQTVSAGNHNDPNTTPSGKPEWKRNRGD
jgi:hypothetical protein